jgi:hypothetical protein
LTGKIIWSGEDGDTWENIFSGDDVIEGTLDMLRIAGSAKVSD